MNYNYILVSKDVLQLSGKEVELSCERVTVTVSRGRISLLMGTQLVHQAPVQELLEVDSRILSREDEELVKLVTWECCFSV